MKVTRNKSCYAQTHSFTLIELLIVIGLLGALTALILPSLTATREDAIADVCDYNQAGTVRVLKQFKQLYGHYPADMHTGLQSNATAALAMVGLPDAQAAHMGQPNAAVVCPSVVALSETQASSLKAAGITSVCHDVGLKSTDIAAGVFVVQANNGEAWEDDSTPAVEMTFDGVSLTDWAGGTNTPKWDSGSGIVLVLWITPTIDWETHGAAAGGANNDWSKGSVHLGLDIQGQCPIPAQDIDGGDPEFAYYMAYFKVYDNGTPARLIGTTCPECGVLNP